MRSLWTHPSWWVRWSQASTAVLLWVLKSCMSSGALLHSDWFRCHCAWACRWVKKGFRTGEGQEWGLCRDKNTIACSCCLPRSLLNLHISGISECVSAFRTSISQSASTWCLPDRSQFCNSRPKPLRHWILLWELAHFLYSACSLDLCKTRFDRDYAIHIDRILPWILPRLRMRLDTASNIFGLLVAFDSASPEWAPLYPKPEFLFPNHWILPPNQEGLANRE